MFEITGQVLIRFLLSSVTSNSSNTSSFHWIAPGAVHQTSWAGDWSNYTNYPDLQLCTNDNDNQAAEAAPYHGFNISTTCCELDGTDGVRPDCNAHPVTYDEAVELCESYGYRLCTLQELFYDQISLGGGCQYDFAFNWVSDTCTTTGNLMHF